MRTDVLPRVQSYPFHYKSSIFFLESDQSNPNLSLSRSSTKNQISETLSLSRSSSMASTLLTFRPTGIQACAAAASSSHRKSDQTNRRTQSSNWWTPLFGWTSDPDYIDGNNNSTTTTDKSKSRSVDSDSDTVSSRSRFTPGGFTEEKAKQLRIKTMESETFHDIMYHSAIASRLASDLPMRSGR